MSINKGLVYSIKEVSEILSVHPRKLNRIAKKENLQKVDNRYLFSGDFLIKHFHLTNVEESQKMSKDVKQLTIDTESLNTDITIENLYKEIKDLKAELSQYDILPNERIEVFTTEAYNLFEQRLKEWQEQRKEIEHQEQIFEIEKKSLTEISDHYKTQFEYQKKANDKILNMHQKLIDVIGEQTKISIQRNVIEAIDKEVIKKDTWKT